MRLSSLKKRFPNILWLILSLFLFSLSFFMLESGRRETIFSTKEEYHVFLDDLKHDRIKKIRYSSIDSNATPRKIEVIRHDESCYKTFRPAMEPELLQELGQHAVEIEANEGGIAALLFWLALLVAKTAAGAFFLILVWNLLVRGEFSFSLASDLFSSEISSRWKNLNDQRGAATSLSSLITLKDIAGCREAKRETKELIDYLKDPAPFEKLGARMPRGVLFAGPPGTGKTLLAKAIAAEAGVPFLACAGSEFDEKYVGVGASRIRQIFLEAKKLAPCVIFVDEIDSIGQKRASSSHGRPSDSQTLNQFLIEMDGFEPNDRILVFAATNRANELDPALVRPGRFDRHVILHYPTLQEREEILLVHAKKIKHHPDIDWKVVARMTVGFAGADLANLLNEAALCAVKEHHDVVTLEDVYSAYDRVLMGLERHSLKPSAEELERTAYHEAGHALVSLALEGSDPIHKLTILPRGQSLGATYSVPETEKIHLQETHCYQKLAIYCGGRAAEALIYGERHVSTGASAGEGSDMSAATKLARAMVEQYGFADSPLGLLSLANRPSYLAFSPVTLEKIEEKMILALNLAYWTAYKILQVNRLLLTEIKEALLAKETLNFDDLSEILSRVALAPFKEGEIDALFPLRTTSKTEEVNNQSEKLE